MRAAWLGAGVIFLALSGCTPTQTAGSIGASSSAGQGSSVGSSTGTSGGNGSSAGTSGGQGSGIGTSGGQTTGASNPCAAVTCKPTFICVSDGGCIEDPCFGVTCTAPGAACYGGECKCGGPNGVLCSAPGESCSPIDNSCGHATGCAVTGCPTNTVCNPQDSTCHCGSADGPECGKSEDCILYLVDGGPLAPFQDAGGAAIYGRCSSGGSPCKGVVCPPFEACDVNNNGACECGGAPDMNIPGTVCAADETCADAFDGGEPTCLQNCQPFGAPCPAEMPDASMPVAQACIYFAASQAAVCASPADDAGVIYCDVFPDGGPTSTPPPDGGTHTCDAGDVCTPLPAGIIAGTCEPE